MGKIGKKKINKTILITGSARGIGAEVAKLSKNNGYKVILHGRTDSERLKNISKELDSEYIFFDMESEYEIKKNLEKITEIDCLVNAAGINISKSFDQLTLNDWMKVYSTNVFGLALVIKNSLPILRRKKGLSRIVNIASIKGTYSAVGRVAYASSKASVINLTVGLAKELAPNILVNSVSPGFTFTEMTEKTWSERIKNQVDSILLKRIADPKEIAEMVLFLCSEKCTYITGQNINVDGGFGIKNV